MAQRPLASPHKEIYETDQSNTRIATYILSPSNNGTRIDTIIPKNSNTYAKSILNAFLPAGYPASVTSDYLEYQIYDSLQAFSSSIAGMLSSRAVLEGIGVGNSSASPTSALLLSVLQESMGRVATILFAHRLGSSLEPECKMYRLLADIFNDAAMILDCLSPAFPKVARVGLLSASSVLRALCGVAAGSAKASLSAHFAVVGNLGELNAKDSSQETIISLLGMLAGSLIVSSITTPLTTWFALIFLLAIHLGTNYLAVRAVCMRTLNRQRANLVFTPILSTLHIYPLNEAAEIFRKEGKPTPEYVRRREKVFERDGVLRYGEEVVGWCEVGVGLGVLLESLGGQKERGATGSFTMEGKRKGGFERLMGIFEDVPFVVWFGEENKRVLIVLKEGVDTRGELCAWMVALYCARRRKDKVKEDVFGSLEWSLKRVMEWQEVIFAHLVELGWDIETSALETRSGSRISFSPKD